MGIIIRYSYFYLYAVQRVMATLWAESVDEADELLDLIENSQYSIEFEEIFVAKRHGRHRTNDYLAGRYYRYHPDMGLREGDVSENVAPAEVIQAVQWTSMDIYITVEDQLVFSAENTTQLEGNNLFQRLPRAARACATGSVVVTLQGSGSNPTEMMLQRLFTAHDRIHSSCHAVGEGAERYRPSVVLYYSDEESQIEATDLYVSLIASCINRQEGAITTIIEACRGRMQPYILSDPFPLFDDDSESNAGIKCFDVSDDAVTIQIKANPDKKSWRDKGTGQMDPYVGLIYAAALLHGYDANGRKVRDIVTNFQNLPPGFWWLQDTNGSLYRVLPQLFSDEWTFGLTDVDGQRYLRRPGKCGTDTCHCC